MLEGGGVQSLAGLGVFRSAYGRDFCRSLWNLSSSLVLVSLPWRLSCIVASVFFRLKSHGVLVVDACEQNRFHSLGSI